jgi:hypothetical protein
VAWPSAARRYVCRLHEAHARLEEPPPHIRRMCARASASTLTQPAPAVVAAASPAQAAAAAAMQSGQSNVVDQDEAPAPQYIYTTEICSIDEARARWLSSSPALPQKVPYRYQRSPLLTESKLHHAGPAADGSEHAHRWRASGLHDAWL